MPGTNGDQSGDGNQTNTTGVQVEGQFANVTPNPQGQDTTAAMASVLECMTLQQSTYHIPPFDGRNPPLREFLQDVANGAVFITESTEPGFIKAVLSKLKGAARESVRDKRFDRVNDLISHLKKRFASTKKYQWYFDGIMTIRLKQSETVSDYNDRLQGLLSGAKHALEAKYHKRYREVGPIARGPEISESAIIMQPIIDCALEAFIRGLPEEMSIFVDTRNPMNLEEAFEHALRAEERQRYSDRTKASSYHITRSEDRPRSPSPYSRQVERPPHVDKRRSDIDREPTPSKPPRNTTTDVLQFTPEQLATFYRSMMPQFAQPMNVHPPMQQIAYQPPPAQAMPPMQYQQQLHYPRQNQAYKPSITPPRSVSPGPQGSSNYQQPNLNFQQARRSDAAASPTPQRQKSVHFAENSVGSLEQEPRPKTPQ